MSSSADLTLLASLRLAAVPAHAARSRANAKSGFIVQENAVCRFRASQGPLNQREWVAKDGELPSRLPSKSPSTSCGCRVRPQLVHACAPTGGPGLHVPQSKFYDSPILRGFFVVGSCRCHVNEQAFQPETIGCDLHMHAEAGGVGSQLTVPAGPVVSAGTVHTHCHWQWKLLS